MAKKIRINAPNNSEISKTPQELKLGYRLYCSKEKIILVLFRNNRKKPNTL